MKSEFPYIKIMTPASLVGFRDEVGKKDALHKIFTDAYKSPLSILILDNLERIIEWNPVGPRLSNTILQALLSLLSANPPKGHKLLVMATTSNRTVMDQLDLAEQFDREIAVPAVKDVRELAAILGESGVFESPADINEVINSLQQYRNSDEVGVGVKRVLSLASDARISQDPVGSFSEQLAMQIARANPM
jgi:vesicle-fusing ATPase